MMKISIDFSNLKVGNVLFVHGSSVGEMLVDVTFVNRDTVLLENSLTTLVLDPITGAVLNKSCSVYPSKAVYNSVVEFENLLSELRTSSAELSETKFSTFLDDFKDLIEGYGLDGE